MFTCNYCHFARLCAPVGAVVGVDIDQLRADGVVLTYDPGDRTLRAGDAPSVTIGRDATDVRPRRTRERRTA